MANYPEVCLKAANDALFDVYQDWVQQNPRFHLDVGINEDGKCQNRWRKIVCLQIQSYEVPCSLFGEKISSIFSVELDGTQSWKCNSKRVIVFNHLSCNASKSPLAPKNICAWIEAQLDSWNCVAFDEHVNNSYTAAMGYPGKARGTQSMEKHHHTFSKKFLRGKLREAVRFVCKQKTGGVLQPNKLSSEKRALWMKPLHGSSPPPPIYAGGVQQNAYLNSCRHYIEYG